MFQNNKHYLITSFKYTMLCLLYVLLSACSDNEILQKPLVFNNTAELFRVLEKLEKTLPPQNYEQLTDAIGHLKAMDTEHVSIEAFYQSLAGLSIQQIITKSHALESDTITNH